MTSQFRPDAFKASKTITTEDYYHVPNLNLMFYGGHLRLLCGIHPRIGLMGDGNFLIMYFK